MSQMRIGGSLLFAVILLSGCATSNYKILREIGPVDYGDKRTYASISPAGTAQIRAVNGKRMVVGGNFYFCAAIEREVADAGSLRAAPGRYTLTVVGYRLTKLVADGHDLIKANPNFRRSACTPGITRVEADSETTEREFHVTFDLEGGMGPSGEPRTYRVHLLSSQYGFVAITRDDDPTIIASSNAQVVGRSIKEFPSM